MAKFKHYIPVLILLLYPICAEAKMNISLIVPVSGAFKIWGDELTKGAQIAIDEINKDGGIRGKKLVLNVIDDPCRENLTVSTAQMISMRNDKPDLIIGPYCSQGAEKVMAAFAKSEIFQIMPLFLSNDMSLREQAGTDFYDFYNQHFPGMHAAVLFDDTNEKIVKSVDAAESSFRRHGKSRIFQRFVFRKELSSLAKEIVGGGTQIVMILGKPKQVVKTIRLLKKLDKNIIIVTGKHMIGSSIEENSEEFWNNVYFMGMPSFENDPDFAEYMVHSRLKGIELDGLNIDGYAAVKNWAELVQKAGSTQYEKLKKAMAQKDKRNNWYSRINSVDSHYVFYLYKDGEFISFDD